MTDQDAAALELARPQTYAVRLHAADVPDDLRAPLELLLLAEARDAAQRDGWRVVRTGGVQWGAPAVDTGHVHVAAWVYGYPPEAQP